MRKRIKVIANPISGRGRAARLAPRILYRLHQRGCHLDFLETEKRGDAQRFAEQTSGYGAVACVGGDGTVNEVLNGLPDADAPPLAFIPSGTANVLAKELKLPWRVEGLADVIVDGREIWWDVGLHRLSGRKFLLFAGAGFDSMVVEKFLSKRKKRIHITQYIGWGLKTIPFYRPPKITVEIDGRIVERNAAWVEVSNVSQFGGPLVFTPDARPDDGLFEVMIQKGRRRRDTVRMFFGALFTFLFKTPYRMNDVVFVKGRRVRMWSTNDERVPLQIDGDPAGALPADLELLPGKARLLAPQ